MKVVLVLALCAAAALAAAPIAIPKLQLPQIPGLDEPINEASNEIVQMILEMLNFIFIMAGNLLNIGPLIEFVIEALTGLTFGIFQTKLSKLGDAVEIVSKILNGESINLPTDVDELARGIACIVRELVEYIYVTGEGLADIVARLLILILGDIGEFLNSVVVPILSVLETILYNILPLTDIEGPIDILEGPNVCESVPIPSPI